MMHGCSLAWPLAGPVQTGSVSNQFQFRPVPVQTGSGSYGLRFPVQVPVHGFPGINKFR